MINVNQITAELAKMPDQALQQYAAMHKNDPYTVALALSESNRRKQMRMGAQGAGAMPQPKVVDQDIAQMASPPQQQPLPEDSGIGQLPAQNMQNMAGGGIVAFDEGGDVPGYAEGVFTGLKKKYKELKGYQFEGGPETFERALDAEGIKDPRQRAFLKSIHDKESDQAFNAPTRKDSGASGPMQVTEGAWKDVSKKGEELKNRNDPYDNMRAGIRYASTGWEKAGGDPALASTYYYGGPGGFNKAKKGQGVAALEDMGQTTLQYGNDVAEKMKKFLPKSIVPGTETNAATGPENTQPELDEQKRMAMLYNQYVPRRSLQAQSFGTSMGPSIVPQAPLDINASPTAQTAPIPAQLGEIAYKETAKNAGLPAALPKDMQAPFERNTAPLELSEGQKPEWQPDQAAAPEAPKGGMPDLNEAFRRFEIGQQNKTEDVQLAKPEEAPEGLAAIAPEAKKDGTDWNDFMIKMGLNLMASKDPNAISGVGQAGLGTLAMQQAEAKAKTDAEAKAAEAEYHRAKGKESTAYTAAIERGAKEKNNVALAEKAASDLYKAWADSNRVAIMTSPGLADQKLQDFRADMYRRFGIEPTMVAGAAGAPGGQKLVYNPQTGKIG